MTSLTYWVPELEDYVYDEQYNWIMNSLGKEAANHANYGWVVDEIEGVICTKVYGHGVLCSTIKFPTTHDFEEY